VGPAVAFDASLKHTPGMKSFKEAGSGHAISFYCGQTRWAARSRTIGRLVQRRMPLVFLHFRLANMNG